MAIDFGTCSTIVAVMEDDKERLVRIGTTNLGGIDDSVSEYENPTMLAFWDQSVLSSWKTIPHRTPMNWQKLQCSHEVKGNLQSCVQNNNFKKISSIMDLSS